MSKVEQSSPFGLQSIEKDALLWGPLVSLTHKLISNLKITKESSILKKSVYDKGFTFKIGPGFKIIGAYLSAKSEPPPPVNAIQDRVESLSKKFSWNQKQFSGMFKVSSYNFGIILWQPFAEVWEFKHNSFSFISTHSLYMCIHIVFELQLLLMLNK